MADRTLILHLGLQRTGTTFLQQRLFPHFPGVTYFYKGAHPAAAAIINAFRVSPLIWRDHGRKMLEELVGAMAPEDRSILISGESMSAHRIFLPLTSALRHPRRDPALMADHLQECQRVAAHFGFMVKAIMGIRRQDQYLGSRYSRHARFIDEPSQADFERQVSEILDPSERFFLDGVWLDYNSIALLVRERLGEDRLLILPQEWLATEHDRFCQTLTRFVGTDLSRACEWDRVNASGEGNDAWRLYGRPLKQQGKETPSFHDQIIVLNADTKAKILSTYRESNEKLSQMFDLNLNRHDYF